MNVEHERHLDLRRRLKGEKLLSDAVAAQLEQPWRSNSFIAQIVFFLLTCIALGAFYGFVYLFDEHTTGLIVGPIAIVLAEVLIRKRWSFTGVEAALWIAGLFMLISELPHSGTPEANLVMAAAAGLAGARVRNPIFGAVAAIFVMIWFEERFDLGVICALAIALLACIALTRTWRRPTTEWLWFVLAVAMPIAGRVTADEIWIDVTISLYAILGVIAFALAITRRHHALFLCAMISFAVAATDLAEKIAAPAEAKLAIAGAFLLAIAFAVTRVLRHRTSGFVLTPMQLTPFDDALEMAATMSAQPSSSAPSTASSEPQPASGGGSFGGAGASGDY